MVFVITKSESDKSIQIWLGSLHEYLEQIYKKQLKNNRLFFNFKNNLLEKNIIKSIISLFRLKNKSKINLLMS
jgi:hypothetical protein